MDSKYICYAAATWSSVFSFMTPELGKALIGIIPPTAAILFGWLKERNSCQKELSKAKSRISALESVVGDLKQKI